MLELTDFARDRPGRGGFHRVGRWLLRAGASSIAPPSVFVRRVRTAEPYVSLTFDDGPDEHTPELLDLLDRLELRATFFVLGESSAQADRLGPIVARGHEVASHGYAHRPIVSMTYQELRDDLRATQELLPLQMGPRPLFRPPRGELSAQALAAIWWLGYTTVLWSFDSLDHKPIDADAIAARFLHHSVSAGDIVLLHEGEASTREALPVIAGALRQRGLRSVPVSTLLASASQPRS
jgi:peptidoglycan/xylan/chitin deacetylase (PgdA/CDA1 family)